MNLGKRILNRTDGNRMNTCVKGKQETLYHDCWYNGNKWACRQLWLESFHRRDFAVSSIKHFALDFDNVVISESASATDDDDDDALAYFSC